jgi:hypothetical protein
LEVDVAEELQAWAEDCVVRGAVELPDGRLSDAVNHLDLLQFRGAKLEALDDGRVIEMEEVEIERRDLHVVLVQGREGDPSRKLRTVRERVIMEIGPFRITGNLHRSPHAAPLAALNKWTRFIPVTESELSLRSGGDARHDDAILVNRELIQKVDLVDDLRLLGPETWPQGFSSTPPMGA